jgi:hypothetical protein
MVKVDECDWCKEKFDKEVEDNETCCCICGVCYDMMIQNKWKELEERYATKIDKMKTAAPEKAPLDILSAPAFPDDKDYWKNTNELLGFPFGNEKKKETKR